MIDVLNKIFTVIIIISVLLPSCSLLLTLCTKDTTEEATADFSGFSDEKNEVALIHNDVIYTEDAIINLRYLSTYLFYDKEPRSWIYEIHHRKAKMNRAGTMLNSGIYISDNMIWFSTVDGNAKDGLTLNIYTTDLSNKVSGKDLRLVYSKSGFDTRPYSGPVGEDMYFLLYSSGSPSEREIRVDRYSIAENKYETVTKVKERDLSDAYPAVENRYTVTLEQDPSLNSRKIFVISDSESGMTKVIDDVYLESSIYSDMLNKYGFNALRSDVSNGHVLLTYAISAGNINNTSYLVFEYDFESDTLEYKLLAFTPNDDVAVDIVWIGE